MSIKKYLSLERLAEYDALLKAKIAQDDAATLDAAKDYVDGLIEDVNTSITNITNGDIVVKEADHATSADSATTAESATKATQDGNGNVIADTYETKADASAKLAEAKSYADGKDTAIQAAQTAANNAASAASTADGKAVKAQEDVDALKTYVGTIPTTATATDIVGYVQEKTSGIATSENLQELTNRVAEAETDIGNIAKDYLTSADKTELQTNIDTVSSAVELLTNGVDAETVDGVNDLIAYVNEHGTEVTGMKADIKANADALAELAPVAKTGSWNDLADRPFGEEGSGITLEWHEGLEYVPYDVFMPGAKFYKLSDTPIIVNDVIPDISIEAMSGGALISFPNDEMNISQEQVNQMWEKVTAYSEYGLWSWHDKLIVSLEKDGDFTNLAISLSRGTWAMYRPADDINPETHIRKITIGSGGSSIKTLDEKYIPDTIARTADQDALASRVTTAETDIDTLEGNFNSVSTAFGEYKDAHASDYTNTQIDEAIKVVADNVAALNDTYASDEELAQAIADEVSRANGAYAAKALETTVSEHKADTVAHITAAERTLWNASEKNAKDYADGLNTAMTTKVDGAIDRVSANETAIGNLNAAVAGKVAQGDFNSAVERVAVLEAWHEGFEECTTEDINNLFNS